MNHTVTLPDLGEGLAEGEITEWHVSPGDRIEEDQPLVDVSTDKAIVAIPAPVSGVVAERHGEEGDTIAVGTVLVVIATAGDDRGADDGAVEQDAAPPPRRPLAAPSLRREARERGIELAEVTGTGPAGRILPSDLDAHADGPPVAAQPPAVRTVRADDPPAGDDPTVRTPVRGLRRATARAMTASWQTVPHIFDFREADATAFVRARAALRSRAERTGDPALAAALSPVVLMAKVAAVALASHPQLHGYVDGDDAVHHRRCHLAIATAAPDGLLAPVLRDVDRRSVADLARDLVALVGAARERALSPDQLHGGTFMLNNLGALGTWYGTPLIAPGYGGNLGFGRVVQRPVVRDGTVEPGAVMPLSISADHRLVDGDVLAAFARTVAELVEDPVLLLAELA